MKHRECEAIGIRSFDHRLAADASEAEVIALIERLNGDPAVSGVLVQLPLPDHLDGVKLTGLVDVHKDVDGLTPLSAGLLALGRPGLRPCTPSGVMALLESIDAPLEGAEAVVVGRSKTCSESRWRSCSWRPTRPSRPLTRARETSRPCAPAPMS